MHIIIYYLSIYLKIFSEKYDLQFHYLLLFKKTSQNSYYKHNQNVQNPK